MSKPIKSFLKSATLYTVLNFLPASFSLILTPLFTNHLKSTDEYALLILANFFALFFGVFIGLGFDSAYSVKYFHFIKNKEKQTELLLTTVVLIGTAFALLYAVLLFCGDYLFAFFLHNTQFSYSGFGQLTLLLSLATVLNALILVHYRNENNLRQYTVQAISMAVLPAVLQIFCIFFVSNTARGIIAYRSITSLAVCLLFISGFFFQKGFRFNFSILPSILKLSIPFAAYSLIIFLFENIDRLIVERSFKDLHVLSIYGLALTFTAIAELIRSSVASALSPAIFQVMAEDNDAVKLNSLYRLFIWTVLFLIGFLLLCIQPIFKFFITNPDFYRSLDYIPLLFLALIPKIYYSIYQLPLSYHSKVGMLPVINIISLIAGTCLFFLTLPFLQLYAIILSLFTSRTLQSVFTLFYLKRLTDIYEHDELNFEKEKWTLVIAVVSILIGFFLYKSLDMPFWVIGLIPTIALLFNGLKLYKGYKKVFSVT